MAACGCERKGQSDLFRGGLMEHDALPPVRSLIELQSVGGLATDCDANFALRRKPGTSQMQVSPDR